MHEVRGTTSRVIPPVVNPTKQPINAVKIPPVSTERFTRLLYRDYLEWVKAGKPRRT